MDIPILTDEGFYLMEQSVEKQCKNMLDTVGISVALWRLNALMKGYKYALQNGYKVGVAVEPLPS